MGEWLGIAVTPSKWRGCLGHCSLPYSLLMEGEGLLHLLYPTMGVAVLLRIGGEVEIR